MQFQFNEIQKAVCENHMMNLSTFNNLNDRLDVYLGKYFTGKDVFHVCKLIFCLSHGQSFVERGFSVHKELVDTNMKENSLIAKHLIYDKIISGGTKVSEMEITPGLRKSCMLASQRYKQDLQSKKPRKSTQKKSLKRKRKCEELENLKRQSDLKATFVDNLLKVKH